MRILAALGLVAVLLVLGACRETHAEQHVWGCVLHATNTDGPSDERVQAHVERLREVFGYRRFTLLGSAWGGDHTESAQWVQPTKEFFLRITPAEKEPAGTYRILVYQNQKELLQTTAKLPPNKPLFIAGQNYGKGKLIVLLEVRRP
jgi:hypothetical protein